MTCSGALGSYDHRQAAEDAGIARVGGGAWRSWVRDSLGCTLAGADPTTTKQDSPRLGGLACRNFSSLLLPRIALFTCAVDNAAANYLVAFPFFQTNGDSLLAGAFQNR